MQIFALFMLCGVFTTLLIPETKRKTLEELSGEDTDTLVNPSPMIHPEKVSGENKSETLPV
jgi:PHS family inorganic phosphate transporter-like MFS transporter